MYAPVRIWPVALMYEILTSEEKVNKKHLDDTASRTLQYGNEDAQYLAMMTLRYLGHTVEGHGYWEDFYWTLDNVDVIPNIKPQKSKYLIELQNGIQDCE